MEEGGGREAVRLGVLDLVMASGYDQVPEPPVPGLVPALVPDRPGSPVVRIPPAGIGLRRRISAVTRAGAADRPAVRALLAQLRAPVG